MGETIKVKDLKKRLVDGRIASTAAAIAKKNKLANLEHPLGEWNQMVVIMEDDLVRVRLNGIDINNGFKCSAKGGSIALVTDGGPIQFRDIVVMFGTGWR